ncbi:MAG: zinc-binding dehydrogenase [Deltaproteobacteria bacterium]|nr:zinc-binding dehydrogenase [Deltaproteobacteria bacterium]
MNAVRIHAHGGIDRLRYEAAEDPQLTSADDAIVKLHAASVNPMDICIRHGLHGMEVDFPHILGSDGAGTVVATGARVRNVQSGAPVCLYPASGCGDCDLCVTDREYMCARLRLLGQRQQGTYAEYVRVPARNCFPIPAELSFEEAAALPFVYITVWRMLITNAQLKPGESVLIRGIGGGVVTAALQLAGYLGTHTLVTAGSDEELLLAKNLGAEHAIDDRCADFSQEVRNLTGKRGVDVVVDCVGGDGWSKSLASLAKGGRLVTCGATAGAKPQTDVRRIFWNDLKIFGSTLGTREEFGHVLSFMKSSHTKPKIDQVFRLKDAAKAHQRMAQGKQFGKIILRVDG